MRPGSETHSQGSRSNAPFNSSSTGALHGAHPSQTFDQAYGKLLNVHIELKYVTLTMFIFLKFTQASL